MAVTSAGPGPRATPLLDMGTLGYVIVSPVRNEARNIEATFRGVAAQTFKPLVWLIVDDGSTDGTPELVERLAQGHDWVRITRLPDRGYYDLLEAGELKAFLHGLGELQDLPFQFFAKLDGDIALEPDYFERLLARFQLDPSLGIASGTCWHEERGKWVKESVYENHVRGALRMYRRRCWEDIGGTPRALGWDAVDCYLARMRGWQTRTFDDMPARHLVKTWSKGGWLPGRKRSGRIDYLIGTDPLFFAAKCLRALRLPPLGMAAAAQAWGYWRAWLAREPRVATPEVMRFVRQEQRGRLLHPNRRPSIAPSNPATIPAWMSAVVGNAAGAGMRSTEETR